MNTTSSASSGVVRSTGAAAAELTITDNMPVFRLFAPMGGASQGYAATAFPTRRTPIVDIIRRDWVRACRRRVGKRLSNATGLSWTAASIGAARDMPPRTNDCGQVNTVRFGPLRINVHGSLRKGPCAWRSLLCSQKIRALARFERHSD